MGEVDRLSGRVRDLIGDGADARSIDALDSSADWNCRSQRGCQE